MSGHTDQVKSIALSSDGHLVASTSRDQTVRLWDAATGRELRSLAGGADKLQDVTFTTDGRFVAAGSRDKMLRVWSVETGQQVLTLTLQRPIFPVKISPDGHWLASGNGNDIDLWKLDGNW